MHGHDADAVAAFFQNGGLRGLSAICVLAQLLDEAAERDAAGGFVRACEFSDVQHVRQRLFTGRAKYEGSVRSRCFQ